MDPKDNELIKKIESGEIKMRPKYYFLVRDGLVMLAALAIFAISALLVSLIYFALRESDVFILPHFGTAGFRIMIAVFPWIPVVIALILTFCLSLVLQKYSFAYRRPLLYLPLLVITILIASGVVIGQTPLHRNVREFSHRNHTAFVEPLYNSFQGIGNGNVTIGQIVSTNPNQLQIISDDQNSYTIMISGQTQFPFGDDFVDNEHVAIIGNRSGNTINAIAIRRLPFPTDQGFTPPPRGFFLFER